MLDRYEKFSLAIAEINHCWHKIAGEELSKYSLKTSHGTYLLTLYRNPEGLTAPKLAELCGRDKADISRAVSAMESLGLLTREGDNPYRARLKLTETGTAAALSIRETAAGIVDRVGSDLTPEKREIFYEALAIVSANLEEYCEKGF